MKAKNTLLFLASTLIMSACTNNRMETYEPEAPQTTEVNRPDTVRVVGVWNQPRGYLTSPRKYLRAVNKNGKIYEAEQVLHGIVPYIERGDTVVIQGNEIVRNLTMERLQSEYTKGR